MTIKTDLFCVNKIETFNFCFDIQGRKDYFHTCHHESCQKKSIGETKMNSLKNISNLFAYFNNFGR